MTGGASPTDEEAAPRRGDRAPTPELAFGLAATVAVLGASLFLDGHAAADGALAARALGGFDLARPLAGLLGRVAWLLPIGDAAARFGLGAALLAAIGAMLAVDAVRRLMPAGSVALAGGATSALLLLAGGPISITQSAAIAVFSSLLALLSRVSRGAPTTVRGQAALSLFLLLGLGAGLGLPAMVPMALVLIGAALLSLRRGEAWPLLAPLALAVGAAVLLSPSVAGQLHGESPRPLSTLWGALWPPGALGPVSFAALPARLGLLGDRLGLPVHLCAAIGVAQLVRARATTSALLLSVALVAPALVGDGADPAALGYSAAAGAIGAGLGIATLALAVAAVGVKGGVSSSPKSRSTSPVGAVPIASGVGLIVAAAAWLVLPWARFAPRDPAVRWARAALDEAPARALVIARGARGMGGASVLEAEQRLAGRRPDVTVIERDALITSVETQALCRAVERGGGLALSPDELTGWRARSDDSRRRDAAWLLEQAIGRALGRDGDSAASTRAVRWEPPSASDALDPRLDLPAAGALVPGAPLWSLVSGAPQPSAPLPELARRVESLAAQSGDPLARSLGADALTALAESWILDGDRRAQPLLEAALALRPDAPRATLLLADSLLRRDQHALAIQLAAGVLARHPERLDAHLAEARYRLAAGDLDGAAASFGRAAAQAPSSAAPHVGLARVARARGRLDEARAEIERALMLDPADAEAREWR